ncbi:Asp/Glu/hydantoin racemase [Xylogone sp. PMI_703]|nr:Asp/Glu/hydantoin racemase [Xylogone sp. PMI_703]
MESKTKTVGIIGGSTDLATAEYYKLINAFCRQELGGLHTCEIIINSMDVARSTYYVQNNLWDEGGEFLHSKAQSLERAGADFIICVSNTWHRVASVFMKDIKIPLLHIVDPTANAIKELDLNVVALLGTKATMSGTVLQGEFRNRFGITVIAPNEEDQTYVDDVIFNELANWKFTDESKAGYLRVIDRLVSQGAQGIILGCTEIPLLIAQSDRPDIPMFNTLELHAKAAARKALDK